MRSKSAFSEKPKHNPALISMVIMLRSKKAIEAISIVYDLSLITMVVSAGLCLGVSVNPAIEVEEKT